MQGKYLVVTPYQSGYVKLTYKTVSMVEQIFNKYKRLLEIEKVDIDDLLKQISYHLEFRLYDFDEYIQLLTAIYQPRFMSKQKKKKKNGKQVFDMVVDFDVIYHDFKINGICDLIEEDIDWVKFNFHVNSFMNSQTSAIALRIQERDSAKSESRYPITRSLNY